MAPQKKVIKESFSIGILGAELVGLRVLTQDLHSAGMLEGETCVFLSSAPRAWFPGNLPPAPFLGGGSLAPRGSPSSASLLGTAVFELDPPREWQAGCLWQQNTIRAAASQRLF